MLHQHLSSRIKHEPHPARKPGGGQGANRRRLPNREAGSPGKGYAPALCTDRGDTPTAAANSRAFPCSEGGGKFATSLPIFCPGYACVARLRFAARSASKLLIFTAMAGSFWNVTTGR